MQKMKQMSKVAAEKIESGCSRSLPKWIAEVLLTDHSEARELAIVEGNPDSGRADEFYCRLGRHGEVVEGILRLLNKER